MTQPRQSGATTACAFCGALVTRAAVPRVTNYVPIAVAAEHERWCPFVVSEGFTAMERLDDPVTVPEAAELAGVSTDAVRMAIHRGVVKATKDADTGRLSIRFADLIPYLLDRRRERTTEG